MSTTKSLKKTAKSSRGIKSSMARLANMDAGLKARLRKEMKNLRTESGAQVNTREIDRIVNRALRKETGAAVSQGEKKRAERLLKEMD
jgi:hypothetical protein